MTSEYPGFEGVIPQSPLGMMFAGAEPQAWFQSELGLNFMSQASSVIVDPDLIMFHQLRSDVDVSRLKA